MSGLVFGCLDVVVRCLDLYSCVWTCIWVSGLVFGHLDLVFLVSGVVFWGFWMFFRLCTCRMWLWRARSGTWDVGPGPGDPATCWISKHRGPWNHTRRYAFQKYRMLISCQAIYFLQTDISEVVPVSTRASRKQILASYHIYVMMRELFQIWFRTRVCM